MAHESVRYSKAYGKEFQRQVIHLKDELSRAEKAYGIDDERTEQIRTRYRAALATLDNWYSGQFQQPHSTTMD